MPDDMDRIQETEQMLTEAAIQNARQEIPAGEPGDCNQCGELMPRLVGGRCARCRDGKR